MEAMFESRLNHIFDEPIKEQYDLQTYTFKLFTKIYHSPYGNDLQKINIPFHIPISHRPDHVYVINSK